MRSESHMYRCMQDVMQCSEHTFQASILQYISRSRFSRKRHAGSRPVAHFGPRARSVGSLPALARPVGGLCGRETARLRAGFQPQSSVRVGQGRRAWCNLPPTPVSSAVPSYPRHDRRRDRPKPKDDMVSDNRPNDDDGLAAGLRSFRLGDMSLTSII